MRLSKVTFAVILSVLMLGALFTGVTTAQQSDEWCLNVSSEVGSNPTQGCGDQVISTHDNVSVTFQRTTPATNNDVYFLPTIVSNSRQAGTVELSLIHTPTGDTVSSKSINVSDEPGREVASTSLRHERQSGGEIDSGEYEVEVVLKNSDGEVVAEDSSEFGSFYISNVDTSADQNTDDNTDDNNEGSSGSGNATVVPEDVGVQVTDVISDVSRYNDQTTEVSPLQDTSIPPLVKGTGSSYNTGVGVFRNFSSMRERQNPLRNDATVKSVEIDGKHLINVGTVTYGIPQASSHRLVLTYSMQVAKPAGDQKIVGVEIVNSKGEVIDEDKKLSKLSNGSPRWLDDTVKDSVDTSQLEQLENADDDILNERAVTIQLTQEEIEYINNNYQAYIVYRTSESGSPGGLTVFKPFRAAIYSTDESNIGYESRPENPVAGDSVQFSITDLPDSFCNCDQDNPETGQVNWNINGETVTTNVSASEFEDLRQGTIDSIEGPSKTFDIGGVKNIEMTVITPDNAKLTREKSISVLGENEEIEDTPATFDVSYEVLNEINPKYGTVDVPPTKGIEELNTKARVEVTVKNSGNSEIRRRVALMDDMNGEFGYTAQTREKKTMTVPPKSTETVRMSTQWAPDEYGRHDIYVVEYKDGEPQKIPNSATGDYKTSVYVMQPATLKIREVIAPQAHLVYDNFDGTAKLENVGDLSTKHPASKVKFTGKFTDTWSSERVGPKNLPEIAGGNVRDGTPGETKRVSYDRDIDYTPSYPDFTQEERDKNDSPWTDTTSKEAGGSEFDLEFETKHLFAEENTARFRQLNDKASQKVRIYRMRITSMTEDGNFQGYTSDSSAPEFFASGYKFTETHYTSSGELSVNETFANDQHQWSNWNENAIPTTSITDVQQMTKDTEDGVRYMNMRVGIVNPGTAPTGTARVKVVSDQQIYYPDNWEASHAIDNRNEFTWINQDAYSNKVVGVAGIDLQQWEKRTGNEGDQPKIRVPIVIPNHPQNEGVHTLTVKVRHTPDYIKPYEEGVSWQFEYKIDVKVWGDSMYIGYENLNKGDQYEQEVYQNCSLDSVDGIGECKGSGTTDTNIDFVYRNVGGAPVTQTVDAHFHEVDPSNVVNDTSDLNDHFLANADARHLRHNRLTSEGSYDNTTVSQSDFWQQSIQQTLQPVSEGDPYQVWKFNHDFVEPGLYHIHPYQWRVTEDESKHPKNHLVEIDRNQDFKAQSDQMQGRNKVAVMVWDDMKPVPRYQAQNCTMGDADSGDTIQFSRCLFDEYHGLSSVPNDYERDTSGQIRVWEGGAIRIDGEQRERLTPSQAETATISSDNVGIDKYKWSLSPNRSSSDTAPYLINRFDNPGQYDITLTTRDHDEYVDGGEGTSNVNTKERTVVVEDDTSEPTVNLTIDSITHSNPNLLNTGSTNWADYATVNWDAYVQDNEVGIEEGEWKHPSGYGTLTPDSPFHPSNDKTWNATHNSFSEKNSASDVYETITVKYKATDFSGLETTDSKDVTIVTDNTKPSFSCTSGSRNEGGVDCFDEEVNTDDFGYTNGEEDGSGDDEVHDYSASAKACTEIDEEGPNGGIGLDLSTLSVSGDGEIKSQSNSSVKVCVSADVDPSASASCSVSCSCSCSCSSCGGSCSYGSDEDECDKDEQDTDEKTPSSTITVEDFHGNSITVDIKAHVKATAYDYDDDYCYCSGGSDSCPDCPDDDDDEDSTDSTS